MIIVLGAVGIGWAHHARATADNTAWLAALQNSSTTNTPDTASASGANATSNVNRVSGALSADSVLSQNSSVQTSTKKGFSSSQPDKATNSTAQGQTNAVTNTTSQGQGNTMSHSAGKGQANAVTNSTAKAQTSTTTNSTTKGQPSNATNSTASDQSSTDANSAATSSNSTAVQAGGAATAPTSGSFTVMVTENHGQTVLSTKTIAIHKGENLLEYMQQNFHIETTYGGQFIVAIAGIRSQWTGVPASQRQPVDWFLYVNKTQAPVGAASIVPRNGDVDDWDYHRWDPSTGQGG